MRPSGACIYALIRPSKEGVVFEERPRDFIPHTPTPYLRATTPYQTANVSLNQCSSSDTGIFSELQIFVSRVKGFGMKVINCVCCVLVLTYLTSVGRSESPVNQLNYLLTTGNDDDFYTRLINRRQPGQQLLNAFPADETPKTKRPFCNAFTGCGRKRNFQGNADGQGLETGSVRIPISAYKSLLKAAYSQKIQNTFEQGRNEHRSSETPHIYLLGKLPHRKRFDVGSPYP